LQNFLSKFLNLYWDFARRSTSSSRRRR
jgi:hypothetical protein